MSAVGNALALSSALSGPSLLRALNGISPWIHFTAAAEIPTEFRVRRAARREYRYFESTPSSGSERLEAALRLFSGRVDVRSLGRALPKDPPVWREIESVQVEPAGPDASVIVVRAPSFVWGMVRKIVGALRLVEAERLPVPRLASALAGHERLTLPMAEPEPLVLWEVEYPVSWTLRGAGPNRHQRAGWRAARTEALTRVRVLDAVTGGWDPPSA